VEARVPKKDVKTKTFATMNVVCVFVLISLQLSFGADQNNGTFVFSADWNVHFDAAARSNLLGVAMSAEFRLQASLHRQQR
jgi:hypothetical protein